VFIMIERQLKERLTGALAYAPLVWLEGARGVGKATMARRFATLSVDLSDRATLVRAGRDPKGFTVGLPYRSALLNIDTAPFLLPSLEWWVQTYKVAGHFIVTSSTAFDLRGSPTLRRMPRFELYPLSLSELTGNSNSIDPLFSDIFRPPNNVVDDYTSRLIQGGFPATKGVATLERDVFFEQYLETLVSGLRERSRLPRPSLLRKLLAHVAWRSGDTLTQSTAARSLGLQPMTLHRYLALLESLFLQTTIPAFALPGKRLVKSPRLHISDTGLSCFLLNFNGAAVQQDSELYRRLLRSFAVLELKKQLSWSETIATLSHATTHAGRCVDIILEDERGRVVGLQVCASPKGELRALTDLKKLRLSLGRRFHRGVILRLESDWQTVAADVWVAPLGLLYQPGTP
jgi:uncharacterized protein